VNGNHLICDIGPVGDLVLSEILEPSLRPSATTTTPVLLVIAVIDPSGGGGLQQVLFSTILDRKCNQLRQI